MKITSPRRRTSGVPLLALVVIAGVCALVGDLIAVGALCMRQKRLKAQRSSTPEQDPDAVQASPR